jgi:Na+/melibiose symporter-like transporter
MGSLPRTISATDPRSEACAARPSQPVRLPPSLWGTLLAVGLSSAVMLADFMAVSVALPALQRSTGASFTQLQWVLEAYVLSLAVFLMVSGHLSDRFGERTVLLAGLVLFALAAAGAGAVTSPNVLILARAAQGAGAALLAPTGTVLLTRAFGSAFEKTRAGEQARGRAPLAVWSGTTALAIAVAPLAGGLLTKYLSWRFVFFVEAAVAGAAFVVAVVGTGGLGSAGRLAAGGGSQAPADLGTKSDSPDGLRPRADTRFDWLGLGLFAAAVAILVVGLLRTTSNLDGWSSTGVLACFACTGLLLVAFAGTEVVARSPAFPVALLRQRTFAGATVAAFGVSMAVFGPFLVLVYYLSYDLGYSALGTGIRLLALSGVTLPLVVLAVPLSRFIPAKALVFGGLALVAAGLWVSSRLSAGSGWGALAPGLIVAGAGLELVNPRLGAAAASTVGPRSAPIAYRATSTVRQLGVATGVAVSASVFATRVTDALGQQLHGSLSGQQAALAGLLLQGRLKTLTRLAGTAVVRSSFSSATHDALLGAAAAAGVCAVFSLVMGPGRAVSPAGASLPGRGAQPAGAPAGAGLPAGAPLPAGAGPAGAPPPAGASSYLAAQKCQIEHFPAASSPTSPTTPRLEPRKLPSPASPQTGPAPGRLLPRRAREESKEPSQASWAGAGEGRYTVKGQVYSMSGSPVPDATVTLVGSKGERYAQGRAAGDGSFSLEAERPGTYTIVASAPGFRAGTRVFEVGPSGARADFRLFGVGSIVGKVVRTKDGSSLVADIEIRPAGGQTLMRCRSGPGGRFSFDELLVGSYELTANAPGHKAERLQVAVAQGGSSGAEFSLTGVGHVYGAVCSPEGAWVPDVAVSLASPAGEVVATTRADGAGSYHFDEVPEGRWLVSAAGAAQQPVEVAAGAATLADITVEPAGSP